MKTVLKYNPNIAEFEQEYKAALRALTGDKYVGLAHRNLTVVVEFTKPVRLYMGKRRGYVTLAAHEVQSLFTNNGALYYVPMGRTASGYAIPDVAAPVQVVLCFAETDYSAKWASIAASMRKYNMNLWCADAIDAMLSGDAPYIAGLQNYYGKMDRPTVSSFKDVTKGQTLEEMWKTATTSEFGKFARFERCTARRDRSVSLTKIEDGSWRVWAASEFSGCGNGNYYIPFSPTQVFFSCKD